MNCLKTPLRWLICLNVLTIGFSIFAETKPVTIKSHPVNPTRILARYAEGANIQAAVEILNAHSLRVRDNISLVPGLVILESLEANPDPLGAAAVGGDASKDQAARLLKRITALRQSGLFEYVEPDYIVKADLLPNDSSFTNGTLWGLRNTGQNGGANGADVGAVAAWDITTGSTNVIVGIVDTGIRYTHLDLAQQMWRNPGEIAGNGLDDDHDGYVDNIFGINALNGSGNPFDDNDHGSHVAGTIGAAANDGHPHVGVSWQVRLMACKFLAADGSGNTSDSIRCINFAVSKGARILNNSWGGGPFSQALYDAIAAARDRGVLFVAAAGNDGANNDTDPHYPSSYQLDNIISVAAVDRQDKLASFSNYGASSVHLGAPGVGIYSSTSGSDTEYQIFDGTSMATPHVSGVAALVLARFPDISLNDLRQRLLNSVAPTEALRSTTVTGGRVNAFNALNATADGILEINLAAASGNTVFAGRATPFYVRVTDLFGVTNATVSGTVSGQPDLVFANNGVNPDRTANDATYSAMMTIPTNASNLALTVVVSAPDKMKGTNTANFVILVPPPNDNFANHTTITGPNVTTNGSNLGATKESGEPNHAGNSGGSSVWWTWTAPTNGLATIKTDGSSFDTTLGIYTGSSVSSLTTVASDDDSGEGFRSSVTFSVVNGTTYQIAVDGYAGASGNIALSVALSPPAAAPANDNFANAIVIAGSAATVTGSNLGASKEASEPNHAGNAGGKSVWWTWTASADGSVTIKTDGSTFDTTLGVYVGNSVSSLIQIAGDDDSGAGTASLVTFSAASGATYRIAVDGFALGSSAASGNIVLNVSLGQATPTPANDNFANRIAVSGFASVAGANVGASQESGEPIHAGNSGGKSVWWTWTAVTNGSVVVSTAGSSFDTLLAVYIGSVVSSLAPIASNDNDPAGGTTSRLSFDAVAGTTYQIAVDGKNSGFAAAAGNILLSIAAPQSSVGPLNDNFSGRLTISGAMNTVSGSNQGATKESGEPNHAGNPGGKSVWWTWTAPTNGVVTIKTDGSSFDTTLGVYSGNLVSSLTTIASDDDSGEGARSLVIFNAVKDATYQIAVDGYSGASGNITLSVALIPSLPAPTNDNFANRILVTGASNSVTGSNVGATKEPGEPNHAGSAGGKSVWWTWTAPANITVTIKTDGSSFDTTLGVYTGSSVSSLTLVAGDDDNGEGPRSLVNFNAVSGAIYQIAVDGYAGDSGNVVLTVESGPTIPVPANDNFANAIAIPGFTSVTGSNSGATKEPGEPNHAGNSGGKSVWWTWTSPTNGVVTIKTDGSLLDTVLGVYAGNSVSSLITIASDDDSGEGTRSLVTFAAVLGTTYSVAVDGYSGAFGNIMLTVAPGTPSSAAPNDNFADRITITGSNNSVAGSNVGASKETGEPDHAGSVGGKSVWWTWTAPGNGSVSIATTGSDFDTLLAVYTGNAVSALNLISSNDDDPLGGSTSRVTFNAVSGSAYQIAVDGFLGISGNIVLGVAFNSGGAGPANNNFANRIPITGFGTVAGSNVSATKEGGEPNHAGNSGGKSVWWTWTAPTSAVVVINTDGSSFDTVLGVYTGNSVSGLTLVASDDDSGEGTRSLVAFMAVSGTTYQIAVDGYNLGSGADAGNILLSIVLPVALAEALDATNLVWTSSSPAPWFGQSRVTHDGIDAMQSGAITSSQQTILQTTVTGPGTLSFWWKVSSETNFDIVEFRTNDVLQARISGEVNWQQKSISIPAGSHTLKWVYSKDSSFNEGQDQAWVDQVVWTSNRLHLQPPNQIADGRFRLLIGTADGSNLDPARVSHIEVYGTTNLALPATNWLKLTNPLLLTNGVLQMDDSLGANSRRFYIVVEQP